MNPNTLSALGIAAICGTVSLAVSLLGILIKKWFDGYESADKANAGAIQSAVADFKAHLENFDKRIYGMSQNFDRVADKVTDHAARIESQGRELADVRSRLLEVERRVPWGAK